MADLAAELGFEALELSAGNLGERSPAEFARICSERELAVSCINGGADLANVDNSEFAQGLDQARYYVEMATQMECSQVMLIPGFAANEGDKRRAAERIAEGLTQIVEHAAERGVFITLEDFPNALAPYRTISEMRWMLETVPGLRLTYDNGNWMLGGDDPLTALKALGRYAINVHLKDWEVDPDQSRMQMPNGTWVRGGKHGQGLIDQKAVLAELKAQGYGGYMAFEYEGPKDHTLATRQGVAYLRGVLAEL
jgi:sugar phosphate isomerase/epimerase